MTATAMSKTKILIDCDPGHDDAVAILFAARRMDLLAVTTCFGNVALDLTTRNALAVLELAGLDVPVARGCSEPLVQRRIQAADIHGKSGLDGAVIPEPTRKPIEAHAVDVIIETARQHKGELVVALVGPCTNYAVALRREPRLREWVREITVMGGSTTLGNITPAAEFNIYCDPEAAAAVFGGGTPVRMVGYNVTRVTGFDASDIARLKQSGRKVGTLLGDLMDHYLRKQKQVFGLDVAPMHDVCALVPYVAPDVISYLETSVRIELTGQHTRGMTVCDMRRVRSDAVKDIAAADRLNALVAISSDARPLIDLVVDALLEFH
jgi:inosine-uridine nucleoside N-ribohydrolase